MSTMHITKSVFVKLIALEEYPSSMKESLWFTQVWRRFPHDVSACVCVCFKTTAQLVITGV